MTDLSKTSLLHVSEPRVFLILALTAQRWRQSKQKILQMKLCSTDQTYAKKRGHVTDKCPL